MRRSSAPSQFAGQPSKRPRLGFTPPTLRTTTAAPVLPNPEQEPPDKQASERSTQDILKIITSAKSVKSTLSPQISTSKHDADDKENTDNCNDDTEYRAVGNNRPVTCSGRLTGQVRPKLSTQSFRAPCKKDPSILTDDLESDGAHVEKDGSCSSVKGVDHASELPSNDAPTFDSSLLQSTNEESSSVSLDLDEKSNTRAPKNSTPVEATSSTSSSGKGKTVGARSSFKSPLLSGKAAISFKAPTKANSAPHLPGPSNQNKQGSISSAPPTSSSEVKKSYYAVMWCKLSKKKHKKWEGDGEHMFPFVTLYLLLKLSEPVWVPEKYAILITSGRTASLLDMDGKSIGQSSGYKSSELASLTDGSTLCIGGKEIEVMGTLTEETFKSGKCFQSAHSTQPEVTQPVQRPVANKPFVKPNKPGCGSAGTTSVQPPVPVTVAPRHDPTAPDALVLPRPSQAHQWHHNRGGLPIVDVVVDPYISYHLRPHQRDGVIFLYQCVMGFKNYGGQGVILADEMGLGKTLQSIALLWTLLRQGPYGGKPVIKRAIIITPGSLVKNWFKEFRKWLGQERVRLYPVDADNKAEDYTKNPIQPVFIISYEMFVRNIDAIRRVNFDIVLCDEGHRLKNNSIKTTTFVSSLTTRRRVILTGTPIQNDLQELFSLVDFCNPGILGTSSAFRHVYESPILASREPGASEDVKQLGETRAGELNRMTSMFILRRTQEINNKYLPPKVEMVIFCQPSELQLSLYGSLLHSRLVRSCIQGGCHNIAQHLMCISLLKKLCNHPTLLYKETPSENDTEVQTSENEFNVKEFFPLGFDATVPSSSDSGKLFVLSQMLRAMHDAQSRQRVVLVSNYTQTLDILEQLCVTEGYSFLRLDGQTPTSKRHNLVEQFNSRYGQHFIFLLSSKAGGVGLNLIGACRLILYDIDWNPATDLQAMARVWRDGQKQKVFIYRLLTTGSLEEKIYQRQISKQALSGVVVDLKTKSQPHFSPEELKDLFTLQTNTQCSTHDLLGCPCDGRTPLLPSETSSIQRSCQLNTTAATSAEKQTNIGMDELFQWNHLAGPDPSLSDADPVLGDQRLKGATYIFWNECQQNSL